MDEMKKLLEKNGYKVHECGDSLKIKSSFGTLEMEFYFPNGCPMEIFTSPNPGGAWIRPTHCK